MALSAVVSLRPRSVSIPVSQWEACGPDLEEARAETSAEGCGYFGIEGPETTGSAQEVFDLARVVHGCIPVTWLIQTKIDW